MGARGRFALFLVLLWGGWVTACAEDFYVSVNGKDDDSGIMERPFASLERARDAIRDLKRERGLPHGGVTVWIRGGVYERRGTFELNALD